LIALMKGPTLTQVSKLVTPDGQILVTGIKDLIAPVTEDEQKKFEAIHFGIEVGLKDCRLQPV
jgi:hypothetical protein